MATPSAPPMEDTAAVEDTPTANEGMNIECCICSEIFKNPKFLPCSHTICRDCLVSWLAANEQAPCPICRRPIINPKHRGHKGWEEMVDALPTDLSMEALVESTRVLSRDHACVGCHESAAISICLNCGDKFCESCSSVHKNMSATRHHKVEDLSSLTAERLAASQPTSCSFHSDKPAELFCPTHGATICQLCASSIHRSCPQVTLFEDRIEVLRAELTDMSKTLRTVEVAMDKIIRQLNQQLVEVENQGQNILDNIDADCDSLENAVKDCRHRLKEQALDGIAKIKEKVPVFMELFLDRKAGLTTHRISVDRVKRAMPARFLNDVNPTLKSKIKDLDLTAAIPPEVKALSLEDLAVDPKALKQLGKELNDLNLGHMTQSSSVPASSTEPGAWQFHSNHGKDVMVSDNGQIATFTRSWGSDGIIVASQPMKISEVYEVKVDHTGGTGLGILPCGVVLAFPASLTLPATAWGWERAVTFGGWGKVCNRGDVKHDAALGDKLFNLSEGDRVGVVVDATGCLHLIINGNYISTVFDVPTPCFALFQLWARYRQVTTRPLYKI